MNKSSSIQTVPQQDRDFKIATERLVVEIENIRQDMAESQSRIERLKSETSAILDDTRSILKKLAAA